MKKQIRKYLRWLALAVLIGAAGCSYSCSARDSEVLLFREEEDRLKSVDETQKEGDLMAEAFAETWKETERAVSCFVHVCGEVKEPGVYELSEGQRVYEAISLAGGFTKQAAENYLNLAEPVWDGMKLEVPDKEHVSVAEWTVPDGNQPKASSGKVNLNTATKEELMGLRGIGEARAEDIIRFREERGGFKRIEDIMEISGIKDAAFQKIKDDITV
ncbi:MAG: hypothetical protein HFG54_09145 [Lachnospiraceae bacterium]|jgi:comEA protein|nr:hypothetical protein [Lachnospiraceae bacterium]